jgi:hypothetical protein
MISISAFALNHLFVFVQMYIPLGIGDADAIGIKGLFDVFRQG